MVLLESDSESERGGTVPDFELPDTDGETYSLSSFTDCGAVLVVSICNHYLYTKARFKEPNHPTSTYDDLAVVGINPNDAESHPEDSFKRVQEPVADDTIECTAYLRGESRTIAVGYSAVCAPDPFFLEGTGDGFELVFYSHIDDAMSPDDEVSDYEMRTAVEALLAGDNIPVEGHPSQGCFIKQKDK